MRLTAVSYNIHKCVGGLDGRYDPARIAAVLAHHAPDVVLLQEVAQNGARFPGGRQIDRLTELLGLRHVAYHVNARLGPHRGEYGNAILSRYPFTSSENVDLTIAGRKARSVLHACLRLQLPDGHTRTLHAFNLHLGLSAIERREQLRRFLSCKPFAGLDARTPIVVAGDFNDFWGRLGRMLQPAGFRGPARAVHTFPAYAPLRPLDSLHVRGEVEVLELQRSRLQLARAASDHLPLVAQLRVLGG